MNLQDLGVIDNAYTLTAFIVAAIIYLITFLYQRKQNQKMLNAAVAEFHKSSEKITDKMDELRIERNTLDLQSSMDIISVVYTKTMLNVIDGIDTIMFENNIKDIERKEIIFGKIKSIVNTQHDDDLLILGRIYYKTNRLSTYIDDTIRYDFINDIFGKINALKDKSNYADVVDFIKSKYTHSIQTTLLKLSK